jgi:hypothetical protein
VSPRLDLQKFDAHGLRLVRRNLQSPRHGEPTAGEEEDAQFGCLGRVERSGIVEIVPLGPRGEAGEPDSVLELASNGFGEAVEVERDRLREAVHGAGLCWVRLGGV